MYITILCADVINSLRKLYLLKIDHKKSYKKKRNWPLFLCPTCTLCTQAMRRLNKHSQFLNCWHRSAKHLLFFYFLYDLLVTAILRPISVWQKWDTDFSFNHETYVMSQLVFTSRHNLCLLPLDALCTRAEEESVSSGFSQLWIHMFVHVQFRFVIRQALLFINPYTDV